MRKYILIAIALLLLFCVSYPAARSTLADFQKSVVGQIRSFTFFSNPDYAHLLGNYFPNDYCPFFYAPVESTAKHKKRDATGAPGINLYPLDMVPFGVGVDGVLFDPSGHWFSKQLENIGGLNSPLPTIVPPGISANADVIKGLDPNNVFDRDCSGWEYEALGPIGKANLGFDDFNGHMQPLQQQVNTDGRYHYHGYPVKLVEKLKQQNPNKDAYLLGYSADGYPVYAPEINDNVYVSGYILRSGSRKDLYANGNNPGGNYDGNFVQDYIYDYTDKRILVENIVGNTGSYEDLVDQNHVSQKQLKILDERNGTYAVTPEYPNGTYLYVLTKDWPYIPRYFAKKPDSSFERLIPPERRNIYACIGVHNDYVGGAIPDDPAKYAPGNPNLTHQERLFLQNYKHAFDNAWDLNRDGSLDLKEMLTLGSWQAQYWLEHSGRYDANHDGALNFEEMMNVWKVYDWNRNGLIDFGQPGYDEASHYMQAFYGHVGPPANHHDYLINKYAARDRAKFFNEWDLNKDGSLEFSDIQSHGWVHSHWLEHTGRFDKNLDGKINFNELLKLLAQYDPNGDGNMDPGELQVYLSAYYASPPSNVRDYQKSKFIAQFAPHFPGWDKNKDGGLSVNERSNSNFTTSNWQKHIDVYDKDRNQKLDLHEYVNALIRYDYNKNGIVENGAEKNDFYAAKHSKGVYAETGTVTVSQSSDTQEHTVNLGRSYTDAVVIMSPASFNGADPSVVRVTQINSNSFKFKVQEWDYKDGGHTSETMYYLVFEAGEYELEDGSILKAAKATVDHNFKRINYNGSSFARTPKVFAQVSSNNGASAVATRIKNVSKSRFELRVQEEEFNDQVHAVETVSYIAIDSNNEIFVTDLMNDVTHDFKLETFSTIAPAPGLLAHMQSYAGPDCATLRYKNLDTNSFEIFVEEEKSADDEILHAPEDIAYMLLDLVLDEVVYATKL